MIKRNLVIYYFTFFISLFCMLDSYAQREVVYILNYKTLVLNKLNQLVKNKQIGVRATIYLGGEDGQMLFTEVHNSKTNSQGYLAIDVGTGYKIAGKMSNVDFSKSTDIYSIKLELDYTGGTNYVNPFTRKILNVKLNGVAATYSFSVTSSVVYRRYIGELYGGGIIFNLYKDSLGNDHGLIASLHDVSAAAKWGLYGLDFHGFKNASNGLPNTKAMIKAGAESGTAAKLCEKYTSGGHKDWYLPSLKELQLLFNVKDVIDNTLDSDKSERTKGLERKHYWTSTGYSGTTSWFYSFYNGGAMNYGKNFVFNVRAVRAF